MKFNDSSSFNCSWPHDWNFDYMFLACIKQVLWCCFSKKNEPSRKTWGQFVKTEQYWKCFYYRVEVFLIAMTSRFVLVSWVHNNIHYMPPFHLGVFSQRQSRKYLICLLSSLQIDLFGAIWPRWLIRQF